MNSASSLEVPGLEMSEFFFFFFLSFYPKVPLCIFYGFQFSVFLKFPSVPTWVSLILTLSFGLSAFSLFCLILMF